MEQPFIDIIAALSRPFSPTIVEIKPGALTKDKQRALALAYVDARQYMDRLDTVVGPEHWHTQYRTTPCGVICRLTILSVTREEVGDYPTDADDPNKMTTAAMQAFKRACASFGLGRYLYSLPQRWFDYDPARKTFCDRDHVVQTIYALAGYQTHDRHPHQPTKRTNGTTSSHEAPTPPTQTAAKRPPDHTRLTLARETLHHAEKQTVTAAPRPANGSSRVATEEGATEPQLGLIARLLLDMQEVSDDEESLAAAGAIDALGEEYQLRDFSAATTKDHLRTLNLTKQRASELISRLKALQESASSLLPL